MAFLGSWKIDDALTFAVNTHTPSTGAATDADSVPSYRVYEDETGTAILSGSMAKLDDANTTGFYSEQITLSAANGFEKGKCYTIYVSATVGSVTGTLHHTLQIEAEVDANRLNWANVDNPTTTVGLSGTTVKTATDVETDTADIQGRLPAALVSGRIDSSVGAVAAGAITAAAIATDAIDADALATDAVTEIATGMLDLAAGVETGLTLRQAMRLIAAASAGKLSGAATTTIVIRNAVADSKDRITATVDSSGNRSAITVDLT
jgi:hypothetical protein